MKMTIGRITRTAMLAVAFMLCATSSAWAAAPIPTVVWEGDFSTTVGKTGTDGNTYMISDLRGNTITDGNIVIGDADHRSVLVNLPDTSKTKVTILMKYSSLASYEGANTGLASFRTSNNITFGQRTRKSESLPLNLTGYREDSSVIWRVSGGDPVVVTGKGYYLVSGDSAKAVGGYTGSCIANLSGGTSSPYNGGEGITAITLGGSYGTNKAVAWKGAVIEKVALFVGETYTAEDMLEFMWPSSATIDTADDTTFAAKFPSATTTSDCSLVVNESATMNVESATTVDTLTINVAAGKTLTISGAKLTATTLIITGGGVVKVTRNDALSATVMGNGTLLYQYSSTSSDAVPTGMTFTDSAWKGTLWLKNFGTYNNNKKVNNGIGTHSSSTNNGIGALGNAGSFVKFTNVKGYSGSATVPWTLVLEDDGDNYAWYNNNGWGAVEVKFAGLKGDGTFCNSVSYHSELDGNVCREQVTFTDFSAFTGTINTEGMRVGLGGTNSEGTKDDSTTQGSIFIASGKTCALGTVNMVTATGIRVSGTLNVNSATSNAITVKSGATLNATAGISGVVTVNGTVNTRGAFSFSESNVINSTGVLNVYPSAEGLNDGNLTIKIGNRNLKGTVNIQEGATLTLDDSGDALNYDGDGTVNVYGILAMGGVRWTLGPSNYINLYEDGQITGTGNANGNLDFHKADSSQDKTIRAYGNASISANIRSEQDGRAQIIVDEGKTLTVSSRIFGSKTIYKRGSGTLKLTYTGSDDYNLPVPEAGTIELCSDKEYNWGAIRDFSGVIVADGSSPTLKIQQTLAEVGYGEIEITGIDTSITSITIAKRDGTSASYTPEDGTVTITEASPVVTTAACWHDYEFEGNVSDGVTDDPKNLATSWGDTTDIYSYESGESGNQLMKMTQRGGNSSVTYPTTWSAAIRCAMPSNTKGWVIAFGSQSGGAIGLAAGETAGKVMLVHSTSSSAYTKLAEMPVAHSTDAQHVYVFVKTADAITTYCDGALINREPFSGSFANGFQIGTMLAGAAPLQQADANGKIDYLRLYNYELSAAQIAKLAADNEYVSTTPVYSRTFSGTGGWWYTNDPLWQNLDDSTMHQYPPSDGIVEVMSSGNATITVNLPEAPLFEKLTFDGNGAITLVKNGETKLTATELSIKTSVTTPYDKVDFADTRVSVDEGKVLTFDFSGYDYSSLTEATSIYVTGVVEGRANASYDSRFAVTAGTPFSTFASAAISFESETKRYKVTLTPDHVAGSSVYYGGDYITAKMDGSTNVGRVYNNADLTDQTMLIAGDTMVISDAWQRQDNKAWISDTFNGNIQVKRTELNLYNGTANALLAGRTVTVDDGKTLNICQQEATAVNFGALTLNGGGTINFTSDATAASLSGTAGITVDSGKTLTLTSIATFISGGVSGSGVVKLPAISSGGQNFNLYGNENSIVALSGMTGGWLNESGRAVNTTLRLDGSMSPTALSNLAYSFIKITGTGDLTIPNSASPTSITITELADYSGTLINNHASKVIDVTRVTKSVDVDAGALLLATNGTGTVSVSEFKVAGVAVSHYADVGGIYRGAARYNDTVYKTFAEAIADAEEAGASLSSITVLDSTAELPAGYCISDNQVVTAKASLTASNDGVSYYASLGAAIYAASLNSTYKYVTILSDMSFVPVDGVRYKIAAGVKATPVSASVEYGTPTPSEADENGAVTYTKTPIAATYTWSGLVSVAGYKSWTNSSNWTYGDNETATRQLNSADTAIININDTITIPDVTVSNVQIGAVVSLRAASAKTFSATSGIVLTDAAASLTVTNTVTLSPRPTTNVDGKGIKWVTADGSTIYTVADPVAQIGEVKYGSLANALEEASDSATITIVANMDSVEVGVGQKVVVASGVTVGTISWGAEYAARTEVTGNGTTEYAATTPVAATFYSVVGENLDWTSPGNWKVGAADGPTATRVPTSGDTAYLVEDSSVTIASNSAIDELSSLCGTGRLILPEGSLPTSALQTLLTNSNWRATVALSGLTANDATKDFKFSNYGNANSKIQLTNCAISYLDNSNSYFEGCLVLRDNDSHNTAFVTGNGYSDRYNKIGELAGDGAISATGGPLQMYCFLSAPDYTGSISVAGGWDSGNKKYDGRRIVFGEPPALNANGTIDNAVDPASIRIKSGVQVGLGEGAAWNAAYGIYISGTIIVNGNATLKSDETLGYESSTPSNLRGDKHIVFYNGAKLLYKKLCTVTTTGDVTLAEGSAVAIAFADGVSPVDGTQLISWSAPPAGTFAFDDGNGGTTQTLTKGGVTYLLCSESDGLYLRKAIAFTITPPSTYYYYTNVAAALSADNTAYLCDAPNETIVLAACKTINNMLGKDDSNLVVRSPSSEYVDPIAAVSGVYSLARATTAPVNYYWTGATDSAWTNIYNWAVGSASGSVATRSIEATDSVTFPAGTHTVSLATHDGSEKSGSITVTGDVTLQRANAGTWAYLQINGDVSGTGTLTLSHVGLGADANRTISCPVVVDGTGNKDALCNSADKTFTFSNTVTISGEFKGNESPLTFTGCVTFNDGGYVYAMGSTYRVDVRFNGGIVVAANASASLTKTSAGYHHIASASAVTLNTGSQLTIPNNTVTTGATFASGDPLYKVNTAVGESTTVYSLEKKPGTIFSVY